jgi:hypothetical protein
VALDQSQRRIDESSIDPEGRSSNDGLQHETALLILDYLHESIKIPDQFGIYDAGAAVKIVPVVLPDQLIDEVEWGNHNVGSEDVSRNNHLPVFHPRSGSLKTCLSPLADFALGATS